jgi:hypothetical protein
VTLDDRAAARRPTLRFDVAARDGSLETVEVEVQQLLNFGYAARDQAGLRAHLDECVERGLPVPGTVPSLYPIVPERVSTTDRIVVSGPDTYAEVEYALVCAPDGRWLITVASDHSDAAVERESVSRGKNMTPNVLAPEAWWLDDVQGDLDAMVLTCQRLDGETPATMQRDALSTLLAPRDLFAILERRIGGVPAPGTVLLSGTIGGEPEAARPTGGSRSRNRRPVAASLTPTRSRRYRPSWSSRRPSADSLIPTALQHGPTAPQPRADRARWLDSRRARGGVRVDRPCRHRVREEVAVSRDAHRGR